MWTKISSLTATWIKDSLTNVEWAVTLTASDIWTKTVTNGVVLYDQSGQAYNVHGVAYNGVTPGWTKTVDGTDIWTH
jgi:hypothetical protein